MSRNRSKMRRRSNGLKLRVRRNGKRIGGTIRNQEVCRILLNGNDILLHSKSKSTLRGEGIRIHIDQTRISRRRLWHCSDCFNLFVSDGKIIRVLTLITFRCLNIQEEMYFVLIQIFCMSKSDFGSFAARFVCDSHTVNHRTFHNQSRSQFVIPYLNPMRRTTNTAPPSYLVVDTKDDCAV